MFATYDAMSRATPSLSKISKNALRWGGDRSVTRQTEVQERVGGAGARKEKAGELRSTNSETAAKLLLVRAIVAGRPPMRLTQDSASIASSTHSMDTCGRVTGGMREGGGGARC
jgi:hypothetical protein